MSALSENMNLARQAIKYVDKLSITSINVPFRLGSYADSPFSKFDMFMLEYMRSESSASDDIFEGHYQSQKSKTAEHLGRKLDKDEKQNIVDYVDWKIANAKAVRAEILKIVRGPGSKSQKKKDLTALMKKVDYDPEKFRVLWFNRKTDVPDEFRIRSARKAIKFKHGNCGEKSAIAATWLLEQTKNTKDIVWVCALNWDHAWTVMANAGTLPNTIVATGKYKQWPADTVVADGWTGDWYPLQHPYNAILGTAANPFQLYVRKKVQEAQTALGVQEECEWPPKYAPTFRLAVANQKNMSYMSPPVRTQILDVVDDPSSVEDEI